MMPASANDHEFAAQLAFFAILHRVDHDVVHAARDVLPASVHEGPGVAYRLVAFKAWDRSGAWSTGEHGSRRTERRGRHHIKDRELPVAARIGVEDDHREIACSSDHGIRLEDNVARRSDNDREWYPDGVDVISLRDEVASVRAGKQSGRDAHRDLDAHRISDIDRVD